MVQIWYKMSRSSLGFVFLITVTNLTVSRRIEQKLSTSKSEGEEIPKQAKTFSPTVPAVQKSSLAFLLDNNASNSQRFRECELSKKSLSRFVNVSMIDCTEWVTARQLKNLLSNKASLIVVVVFASGILLLGLFCWYIVPLMCYDLD